MDKFAKALGAGLLGLGLIYAAEKGWPSKISDGRIYADAFSKGAGAVTETAESVYDIAGSRAKTAVNAVSDFRYVDTLKNVTFNPSANDSTKAIGGLVLLVGGLMALGALVKK